MNPKAPCSLRLCTISCPEWCDALFPPLLPPPPFAFPEDNSQTSPTFSPLVIAIIGILASAFLLVSYYAIISKYCGKSESSNNRSREIHPSNDQELFDEDFDPSIRNNPSYHEPWLISTQGLDEALIKTITVFKYKKGQNGLNNLVGVNDCSVCLGEFLEDDTLRLLPKCSHAFHVVCIDTWLRSHSNCPLCRANIISTLAQPTPNNNPSFVVLHNNDTNAQNHNHTLLENRVDIELSDHNLEGTQLSDGVQASGRNLRKTPFRALSDLGVRVHGGEDTMKRSISMDHRYETRVDVTKYNHGEEDICQFHDQCLKRAGGESSKSGICNNGSSSSKSGVLHCVMSNVAMKRSFSSGRFLFSKNGRGKNAVIPL
ncbi:putative RING-H2 finger protein ATL53 [Beta vulgaris subsp. vulgaris]|uniref:putative RING-H2 finger protein ATL53 n=1 Tax=Beta vulgaris subsp. vulgaris TaxID=3555 RepID=UPI0020367FC9|nr:putative RING-H2 finger protein ATL53 [Beta vulgaris subsp. vulgaris]